MTSVMDLLTKVSGFNEVEALSFLLNQTNPQIKCFHELLTNSSNLIKHGFEVGACSNGRNFEILLPKKSVNEFKGTSVRIVAERGCLGIYNSECSHSPDQGPDSGCIMHFDTGEKLVEHLIMYWK